MSQKSRRLVYEATNSLNTLFAIQEKKRRLTPRRQSSTIPGPPWRRTCSRRSSETPPSSARAWTGTTHRSRKSARWLVGGMNTRRRRPGGEARRGLQLIQSSLHAVKLPGTPINVSSRAILGPDQALNQVKVQETKYIFTGHGFLKIMFKTAVPNVRVNYTPTGVICDFSGVTRKIRNQDYNVVLYHERSLQ